MKTKKLKLTEMFSPFEVWLKAPQAMLDLLEEPQVLRITVGDVKFYSLPIDGFKQIMVIIYKELERGDGVSGRV